MKKIIYLIFFIFTANIINAQYRNEASFINFRTINLQPSLINPAFTGYEKKTHIDFQFSSNDIYSQSYYMGSSPSVINSFEHYISSRKIGLGLRFSNKIMYHDAMSSFEILFSKGYSINNDLKVSLGLNINNNRQTSLQKGYYYSDYNLNHNTNKVVRSNQINTNVGVAVQYKSFNVGISQISLFPSISSLQWGTVATGSYSVRKEQYRVYNLIYDNEFSPNLRLKTMGLVTNNLNYKLTIYSLYTHLFIDHFIVGSSFNQSILGGYNDNNLSLQLGLTWKDLTYILFNVHTFDLDNFNKGRLIECTFRFYFN